LIIQRELPRSLEPPQCPKCEAYLYTQSFAIVECQNCGLVNATVKWKWGICIQCNAALLPPSRTKDYYVGHILLAAGFSAFAWVFYLVDQSRRKLLGAEVITVAFFAFAATSLLVDSLLRLLTPLSTGQRQRIGGWLAMAVTAILLWATRDYVIALWDQQ
jgi:hypothetical protein